MIIDGHAHSGGAFSTVENIVSILNTCKVDKVVLCPPQVHGTNDQKLPGLAKWFPHADVMLPLNKIIRLVTTTVKPTEPLSTRNEALYRLVTQNPERLIQFYWIDPQETEALHTLQETHRTWRFKGVKAHQCSEVFHADSPTMHHIAEFCHEHHLPFFIHLFSKHEIRQCIQLVQQHPHTNFIVGHLIGLEIFTQCHAPFPHVYFDISPPSLISTPRIMKAVTVFGADHVLLGSDTPYGMNNLQKNVERIHHLDISQESKACILGENMQRLLGL